MRFTVSWLWLLAGLASVASGAVPVSDDQQAAACVALAARGAPDALATAEALLPRVKRLAVSRALSCLALAGGTNSIPRLSSFTRDPDAMIRGAALDLLAQFVDHPQAAETLRTSVRSEPSSVIRLSGWTEPRLIKAVDEQVMSELARGDRSNEDAWCALLAARADTDGKALKRLEERIVADGCQPGSLRPPPTGPASAKVRRLIEKLITDRRIKPWNRAKLPTVLAAFRHPDSVPVIGKALEHCEDVECEALVRALFAWDPALTATVLERATTHRDAPTARLATKTAAFLSAPDRDTTFVAALRPLPTDGGLDVQTMNEREAMLLAGARSEHGVNQASVEAVLEGERGALVFLPWQELAEAYLRRFGAADPAQPGALLSRLDRFTTTHDDLVSFVVAHPSKQGCAALVALATSDSLGELGLPLIRARHLGHCRP